MKTVNIECLNNTWLTNQYWLQLANRVTISGVVNYLAILSDGGVINLTTSRRDLYDYKIRCNKYNTPRSGGKRQDIHIS